MEKLCDTIVFGAADQLNLLLDFDEQLAGKGIPLAEGQRQQIEEARQEIGSRLHEAYDLLQETWENLGTILNPSAGVGPEDASHQSLDSAIRRLREEKEIARRVRERMTQDFGGVVPDSPDGEGAQPQAPPQASESQS